MKKIQEVLIALSIKFDFDWNSTYEAIKNKVYPTDEDFTNAEKYLAATGKKFITIVDEDYPDELKRQPCPPFVVERGGN